MIAYNKEVPYRIGIDALHTELKNRSVNIKDARVIVNCYGKVFDDPEYKNGIFRLRDRKGKAYMNVFISTPNLNSTVTVYSPGAYYQLYIEKYDIFIVYKRFGVFHPNVLNSSVTKRVRDLVSEGVNVKKEKVGKKKIDNDNQTVPTV